MDAPQPKLVEEATAIFCSLADYFLWRQIGLTQQALSDSEDSFAKTLGHMRAQTAAQQEAANAAASAANTARDALVSVQRAFVYFSGRIKVKLLRTSMPGR